MQRRMFGRSAADNAKGKVSSSGSMTRKVLIGISIKRETWSDAKQKFRGDYSLETTPSPHDTGMGGGSGRGASCMVEVVWECQTHAVLWRPFRPRHSRALHPGRWPGLRNGRAFGAQGAVRRVGDWVLLISANHQYPVTSSQLGPLSPRGRAERE